MRLLKHTDNTDVSTTGRAKRPLILKVVLVSICALLIIFSAALVFVNTSSTKSAHAATWNEIFNDDFSGAAGTGLNTTNWKYDTGTGWGTGEVETMSSSTANVQQDGSGQRIRPQGLCEVSPERGIDHREARADGVHQDEDGANAEDTDVAKII